MIEAKELRIGNMVEDANTDTVEIEGIHYIDVHDYKVLIGNYLRYMNYIKPIPLTEEWLVKFGFKHSNREWFELDNMSLCEGVLNVGLKQNLCTLSIEGNESIEVMLCKQMLFVHSLQNLYFALTNEELTIKEDIEIVTPDLRKFKIKDLTNNG